MSNAVVFMNGEAAPRDNCPCGCSWYEVGKDGKRYCLSGHAEGDPSVKPYQPPEKVKLWELLLAWAEGEVSEGWLCERTGINRERLRHLKFQSLHRVLLCAGGKPSDYGVVSHPMTTTDRQLCETTEFTAKDLDRPLGSERAPRREL